MCTNKRYIYNRYIKKNILISCGHCPACLQKKAGQRASRIRNNMKHGEICLFVTLTYNNLFVPYVDLRSLHSGLNYNIPVYRRAMGRYNRVGSDYITRFRYHSFEPKVIDYIPVAHVPNPNSKKFRALYKRPNHEIGIALYSDVIRFIKRLRINLQRNYNYNEHFTYFSCSEYGGKKHRPHFHLLLFIPASAEDTFRSAILKSWPYADYFLTEKSIEIARDCASYVSSYVNSNNRLPSLLETSYTRQKHSYSKGFGIGLCQFSLSSILQKVDDGDMSYNVWKKTDIGKTLVNLPIPKYVIHRWFPKFKGYSRLSPSSLRWVLYHPEDLAYIPECHEIGYTIEDYEKIVTLLRNSQYRFRKVTGLDNCDYVYYHCRAWTTSFAACLRSSYQGYNDVSQLTCHYEELPNSPDSMAMRYLSDDVGVPITSFEFDANKLPFNIAETFRLTDLYNQLCKQKDITASIIIDNLQPQRYYV